MSQVDNGFKTQIRLDFSAPGSLNEDVIGKDVDSGDTSFVFQTPNVIEDITNVIDPSGTTPISFTLFTVRLNNNRTRLGISQQFSTAFTGGLRPIFPKFIGAGQVKFVSVQTQGAPLSAYAVVLTTRTPLVA